MVEAVLSVEHVPQFYELDDALLGAVVGFVGGALHAGDGAIVIATAAHTSALTERLRDAGLDLAALTAGNRYVCMDAHATLSLFMIDGQPDLERFTEIVGGAIDRAAQGDRRVRAFGEMVALLAGERNYGAAVRLVSAAHQRLIPAESYVQLSDDGRTREILRLQQKAMSLEAEVTQRRAAEDQLRNALLSEQAAREAAEAALRQRDEFVSVASHELKTPLTTLSGYAQLMLRRMTLDGQFDQERVAHALRSITSQADKLAQLLSHLLDVSRLEEGKLSLERTQTDVARLVEQAVEMARSWSDKHPMLLSVPPRCEADVDGLRFEQVVTNLLDNAIKYSPDGGPVEVVVSRRRGFVEVSVRDHGLGIPREMRGQIFERFYQAHSTYRGGLGLGLYISRQIVELHGGSIRAEFPRGGGTRFVVRLPVAAARPTRSHTAQLAAD